MLMNVEGHLYSVGRDGLKFILSLTDVKSPVFLGQWVKGKDSIITCLHQLYFAILGVLFEPQVSYLVTPRTLSSAGQAGSVTNVTIQWFWLPCEPNYKQN